MRGYPGSKGGAGVWQRIVSLMPAHDRYIEPYLGGGAVFYAKRPAGYSIVADRDEGLIRYQARERLPNTAYLVADAIQLLSSLKLTRRDLVYLDPPYLMATRTGGELYNYEVDEKHHRDLLSLVLTMGSNVMLSGYWSSLYAASLQGWHREDFRAMTRGGVRTESVWCNFEPGRSFHDLRYQGNSFRERERIKRRRTRWVSRFLAMAPAERAVVGEALRDAEACIATGGEGGRRGRTSSPATTMVDVVAGDPRQVRRGGTGPPGVIASAGDVGRGHG